MLRLSGFLFHWIRRLPSLVLILMSFLRRLLRKVSQWLFCVAGERDGFKEKVRIITDSALGALPTPMISSNLEKAPTLASGTDWVFRGAMISRISDLHFLIQSGGIPITPTNQTVVELFRSLPSGKM